MIVDANVAVIAAFLTFCRVGGCFLIMPGLASVRVPFQVRLFVALAASAAVLGTVWDQVAPRVASTPDRLVMMIGSEILIGGLIGLMARYYMLALQFIGSAIAMFAGYGGMPGAAIEEMEAQAPMAAVISFSALLVLFTLDFHHEIVRALVNSYQVAPVDVLFNPRAALTDLTDTIAEAFVVMLRLGSPFVAYAIIVNLAIGFVNKLTPQIPVYFISLPFVITGALLLLYLGSGVMLSLIGDSFLPVTIGR